MAFKREIAKKCRITDLVSSRYIQKEGWEPNYFETPQGKISRANIMGFIVSKNEMNLLLDDGTGVLTLRNFDTEKKFEERVEDMVTVIGRPRSFNNQVFMIPEIIKKLDNKKWLEYRIAELNNLKPLEPKTIVQEKKIEEQKPLDNTFDSLMKKIFEFDKGEGAKISDVIKSFDSSKANKMITDMIEQGEIFEIKPGIVKVI